MNSFLGLFGTSSDRKKKQLVMFLILVIHLNTNLFHKDNFENTERFFFPLEINKSTSNYNCLDCIKQNVFPGYRSTRPWSKVSKNCKNRQMSKNLSTDSLLR
jgi:hypothetical protein